MREILFRGKTLATESKWVEGFYNHIPCGRFQCDEHLIQTIDEVGRIGQMYNVRESTVGQFTGLTDKNGTKIFEGDIIRIPYDYDEYGHNAGEIYEVYFFSGGFRLKPKYSKARGYWLEDDGVFRVIGNIHDNPELLGGKNDGK